MNVPLWVWVLTLGGTLALLLIDVFVIGRRPHVPSAKETGGALAFYIGAALLFGLGIWHFAGGTFAAQYYAGWLTEYSLSIDNLFVFLIIMAKFGVPQRLQQWALMVGIVTALILRAAFIAVGAAAINNFSWVFYLFGAFLVYTAIKLATEKEDEDDEFEENAFLRFVERRLPATKEWHGTKLRVRIDGKRLITPMFVVILALGTTDLLFALDSIPAIYGLTKEPFLVLTANIFALMGLRQLYFLIGGLLKKLVYLSLGLSVLLAFIGVKLVLHAMHENELPFINGGQSIGWAPDISTTFSLVAIVVILGVTTVASLLKSRRDARAGQREAVGR
ncbi:MAG TPA: TerC/Alx family metal homeostasis membrane protein [Segeticoccus sp.]|uniref:TerC/Alx family metal homeostasis membrane protein n=1 Tax=Segeticoccus sp. TaxID=2706531 RepID=UPI002D7EE1F8|nr:TerC/Alx family metal homeostasis membrane protein [Segeticoccus sp.]HET8599337.1 TerC/Alx family metal homeostasis membrane protein [Segeticoccus sp.]